MSGSLAPGLLRRPRWATVAAFSTLAVSVLAIGGFVTLDVVADIPDFPGQVAVLFAFVTFGVVGALIVLQRPGQPIGWLFCFMSVVAPIAELGTGAYEHLVRTGRTPSTIAQAGMWLGQWYWLFVFGTGLILVPLLYPTGRPPGRRWWAVAWLSALSVVPLSVLFALQPTFVLDGLHGPELVIDNPLGVAGIPNPEEGPIGLMFLTLLLPILLAFASVVVRFRRSVGQERLQIKWLAYAVGLLTTWTVLAALLDERLGATSVLPFGLFLSAVPLCTGVAITRYRLYEIDRIINRTLVYAVVVAVLAGLFTGGVALASTVLPTSSGDLGVAASTLAVAALFNPLRHRVQRFVDRRFYRSRYDDGQVAEAFSARLRDQVDQRAVANEWADAVADTLQPAVIGFWMRAP